MPDRVVTETRRKRALRLREISLSLVIGLVVGVTDAKAQQVPTDRLVLQLDIGWRLAPRPFVIRRVFPVFSELGSLRADHQIQGRGITRGGFSLRLWRNLGVRFIEPPVSKLSSDHLTNTTPILLRLPTNHKGCGQWDEGEAGRNSQSCSIDDESHRLVDHIGIRWSQFN